MLKRALRAVRLLARDGGLPRWLRGLAALGLAPIPGPFDEALPLAVAAVPAGVAGAAVAGGPTGPRPVAATVAAMLAACIYAALAGFSVPTQRALIMLAALTAATMLRQRVRWQELLGSALIGVLLLDPLSISSIGFWLSFGAVTAIFYALGGRSGQTSNRLIKLLRTQWAVGVGLLPLLVLFFRQAAMLSPLANLLAVPVYSLLVVPLVLTGTALLGCWHWGGVLLLHWATTIIKLVWSVLAWLAALPHAPLPAPAPGWPVLLVAFAGAAWLRAPRGMPRPAHLGAGEDQEHLSAR